MAARDITFPSPGDDRDLEVEYEMRKAWLSDLASATHPFEEPQAGERTNMLVEEACLRLSQGDDVVVLALDVFDSFCRHLVQTNQAMPNEGLAILVCVWIANKMVGGDEIYILYEDVEWYRRKYLAPSSETSKEVRALEMRIMRVAMSVLRPASVMEDVRLVAFSMAKRLVLHLDLVDQCELVYRETRLRWKAIFGDIKRVYGDGDEEREALRRLMDRKAFVPMSVFIAALRLWKPATRQAPWVAKLCAKLCGIDKIYFVMLSSRIVAHIKPKLMRRTVAELDVDNNYNYY